MEVQRQQERAHAFEEALAAERFLCDRLAEALSALFVSSDSDTWAEQFAAWGVARLTLDDFHTARRGA